MCSGSLLFSTLLPSVVARVRGCDTPPSKTNPSPKLGIRCALEFWLDKSATRPPIPPAILPTTTPAGLRSMRRPAFIFRLTRATPVSQVLDTVPLVDSAELARHFNRAFHHLLARRPLRFEQRRKHRFLSPVGRTLVQLKHHLCHP